MQVLLLSDEASYSCPATSSCALGELRDCVVDFGVLPIGQELLVSFALNNVSPVELVLPEAPAFTDDSTIDFQIVAMPPNVVPEYTAAAFTVRFSPSAPSSREATIVLRSDAGNIETGTDALLRLRGQGEP